MKKLELNLDALQVESFDASTDGESRGTVMGNMNTLNENCYTKVGSCYRTACCPDTTVC